jgi:hypothetical protein
MLWLVSEKKEELGERSHISYLDYAENEMRYKGKYSRNEEIQ